jgi:hypothetical protein
MLVARQFWRSLYRATGGLLKLARASIALRTGPSLLTELLPRVSKIGLWRKLWALACCDELLDALLGTAGLAVLQVVIDGDFCFGNSRSQRCLVATLIPALGCEQNIVRVYELIFQ